MRKIFALLITVTVCLSSVGAFAQSDTWVQYQKLEQPSVLMTSHNATYSNQ